MPIAERDQSEKLTLLEFLYFWILLDLKYPITKCPRDSWLVCFIFNSTEKKSCYDYKLHWLCRDFTVNWTV